MNSPTLKKTLSRRKEDESTAPRSIPRIFSTPVSTANRSDAVDPTNSTGVADFGPRPILMIQRRKD
jgi:hypothetical protein